MATRAADDRSAEGAAFARRTRNCVVMATCVGLAAVATASFAADASVPCQPPATGGAMFITAACIDPALSQPYVDVDESRTTTDQATNVTVSYRYIHGGFTGSATRFSFYFPTPSQYRGRFFESTYPIVSLEDAAAGTIAFSIANGAYVVSTNNNGGVPAGGELAAYRANAAAAKYSRIVATQVYGKTLRPRGYLSGASGGAYQTLGSAENTQDVWDGFVPIVPGTPNAIPSSQAIALLGLRVLHDKLPQIADSQEAGGSGNPYTDLNAEQGSVLREVTRFGFPLRGWWDYQNLISGSSFFYVQGAVRAIDRAYVNDFWNQPGYAGAEASVRAARVQQDAKILSVIGTEPSGVVVDRIAAGQLLYGADMTVTNGAAAGQAFSIQKVVGNTVTLAGAGASVLSKLKPGDLTRIDNSWSIALQYYPRYQVPSADMYGWNQYRGKNGAANHPQRPLLIGPMLAAATSGAVANGRFHGKMIMLASLLDVEAFPWPADWYRKQAEAISGSGLADDYRLWYMDNAGHTEPRSTYANTHIVAYDGSMQQALLDLDAWVRGADRPPASTKYFVDAQTQLQVPATATERKGVQPVVSLEAKLSKERQSSGDARVFVGVGELVKFNVQAQVPPGAGEITSVEWDFEGDGTYTADAGPIGRGRCSATLQAEASHAFSVPGTYLVGVRVASQRECAPGNPFGRVENLARIRVVVR